tara:strand:+ start:1855 stop:2655 length:801 start_codon:yes stop_codon:yes gene_type:complete
MPESAEVKLTTEYLKDTLENRIINGWVFCDGSKYQDKKPNGFKEFEKQLPVIVENVECKGKFIYFTVFNEKGYFYILHSLRMTGRWQDYEDNYCRWYIDLNDNDPVWFRNPRSLATIEFTSKKSILQKALDNFGPDILTEQFNLDVWNDLLDKYKNKNITSFLMDQSIISGIGNYIKAEALYYAKVSPLRKVGSLKETEKSKLFEGIRIIPRIAYNKNGMSMKDYTNFKGEEGDYKGDLKIYSQPHAKKTKTSDGRMTHWDPKIQV